MSARDRRVLSTKVHALDRPLAEPVDVAVTINGVVYPLKPERATEVLQGHADYRPTQCLTAVLSMAGSPLRDRRQAARVGNGYVIAEVSAVHAHPCAYIRMRKGTYAPCDCGAHQAMESLLATGRR